MTIEGIPFDIANPDSTPAGGNVIVLRGGPPESFAHSLPKRVEIKVGLPVAKFDFLGGIAGWGAGKADPAGRIAMIATVHFADGTTEATDLHDGVEFADYVQPIDLPGFALYAPGVVSSNKQVRWFGVPVQHPGIVEKLILESLDNGPAATTVAITAELPEADIQGLRPEGRPNPLQTSGSTPRFPVQISSLIRRIVRHTTNFLNPRCAAILLHLRPR